MHTRIIIIIAHFPLWVSDIRMTAIAGDSASDSKMFGARHAGYLSWKQLLAIDQVRRTPKYNQKDY